MARDWRIAGTPTGRMIRCLRATASRFGMSLSASDAGNRNTAPVILERGSRPSPTRHRVKVWHESVGQRCGQPEHWSRED